jgi:hypothetical protein
MGRKMDQTPGWMARGLLCGWLFASGAVWGAPRIELELVTQPGFPLDGAQRWMEGLQDLPLAGLRIRAGRAGDRPEVERRGTDDAPVYFVTGVLTAADSVVLPGGTFALRDKARLAEWLQALATRGPGNVVASGAAFGLTDAQLVQLHDQLAAKVTTSTRGRLCREVVARIAGRLELPLVIDPVPQRVLDQAGAAADELEGASSGTALAALLRPHGLVLVPRERGQQVELWITAVRGARESWPIGWPAPRTERQLVPALFEFLDVDMENAVLSAALEAIQQRLQIRLLLDHNSLARAQIDPSQVMVRFPAGRSYVKRVLDHLLFQARLKGEWRVDEAGQPLLWITTLRP